MLTVYHMIRFCFWNYQGFEREKDENRADLCLSSIVFPFERGRLWCCVPVIKMAVRF